MKVIMISGKSQSGKDATAKLFEEQLKLINENFKILIIHFADPVKWLAKDFLNWDGNKNIEGRAILQTLGTEVMRKNYPTYWAEIIAKFISAHENYWDFIIIPDWRFENEFETICQYNSDILTIRVNRFDKNNNIYINPEMTLTQRMHISECELDNFNFEWIIDNKGTLEDLRNSINYIIEII